MINHTELERPGEELHQRFLEAEEKATPEQRESANRHVEQHLSEYGSSYAEILSNIVLGER